MCILLLASFNRTFMELKRRCAALLHIPQMSFNRTFMELKPVKDQLQQIVDTVLIAPLWN